MVDRLPVGHRAHRQPRHAARAAGGAVTGGSTDGGHTHGGTDARADGSTGGGVVPTPGQTVGPFFGYALPYPGDAELVPPGSPDAVRLFGRVVDGHGGPVPDALL